MMPAPLLGAVPRLQFSSKLNLVIDGNSHIAGVGGAQNLPRLLAKTAPVSNVTHQGAPDWNDATSLDGQGAQTMKWQSDKGILVTNLGIQGDTWRKMNGLDGGVGPATTDAAWVDGKVNVLVAWEGTNSLALGGRTPALAIQDASDYIKARQDAVTAHTPGARWIVLVGTVAPRQLSSSQADTNTLNANIESYNALLRTQYKSIGAHGLFDVRQAGSLFNWYDANGNADYSNATFAAQASAANTLWSTDAAEAGAHTHFSSNGNVYIMNTFLLPAIRRLPRR